MPLSLIGKLLGWTGIPQWLLELLVIALVVLGIYFSGVFHERAVIKTQTVTKKIEVEKRVVETDHSHDKELADLRAYRAGHPEQPVRLCKSISVPTAAPRQPSADTADVQPVSGPDPGIRAEPGPDISELLGLFALRADEVSAGLRRRQALEP